MPTLFRPNSDPIHYEIDRYAEIAPAMRFLSRFCAYCGNLLRGRAANDQ